MAQIHFVNKYDVDPNFSFKEEKLNKMAKMALYRSPDYKTSFESVGLSDQEKFNIDFQDGGHLGFPIRMILATFDLQVTFIFPMKFRVNWPFGSG